MMPRTPLCSLIRAGSLSIHDELPAGVQQPASHAQNEQQQAAASLARISRHGFTSSKLQFDQS